MSSFKKLIYKEYRKLISKPKIKSLHHYYGLILEELDELWDQIKLKPKKRDKNNIILESAQICALVKRMAKNIENLS